MSFMKREVLMATAGVGLLLSGCSNGQEATNVPHPNVIEGQAPTTSSTERPLTPRQDGPKRVLPTEEYRPTPTDVTPLTKFICLDMSRRSDKPIEIDNRPLLSGQDTNKPTQEHTVGEYYAPGLENGPLCAEFATEASKKHQNEAGYYKQIDPNTWEELGSFATPMVFPAPTVENVVQVVNTNPAPRPLASPQ